MQHYTLRHRIIAAISQQLFSDNVYVARRGLVAGLRRRGGLGFVPTWLQPEHETAEHRCLREQRYEGRVVFDIGAFHGLTGLFFASRGGIVHAFEPMPQNRKRLQENLALNPGLTVTVHPLAVGAEPGRLDLVMDPRMPGGASGSAKIQAGIAQGGAVLRESVEVATLDALHDAGRIPRPDFIKLDVEGFEAPVLAGGQRLLSAARPDIFIELHGEDLADKRDKTRAVLTELAQAGYAEVRHVETGRVVSVATLDDTTSRGHLLARGGAAQA